jgi:hypothetical protein
MDHGRSLQDSARQLKNTMRNRERRREAGQDEVSTGNAAVCFGTAAHNFLMLSAAKSLLAAQGDAYGERRQRKKRSEPLRAAQEAYAAVMAAASMAVPELLRCELCQVSCCTSSPLHNM